MKIVNVEKRLLDKLVDECNETVDEEVKILDNNENKCNFCILYIALFPIFFTINFGIAAYFVYYKYTNRKKKSFYIRLCLPNKKLLII